jgi:hypothetical protein
MQAETPAAANGDAAAVSPSAPTLQQVFAEADAGASLKKLLSKAGGDMDSLLSQLKVEKGKKGKFVLSF